MRKTLPGHVVDHSQVDTIPTLQDRLRERRNALRRLFPAGSGVDRISLIRAWQNVHLAERYPQGIPENLLTAERLARILPPPRRPFSEAVTEAFRRAASSAGQDFVLRHPILRSHD